MIQNNFKRSWKVFYVLILFILWTNILSTRWIKSWHCWYNMYKLTDIPWIFISLILEILLNFIVFGLLLYVLVLMWLQKKMMTVPFLNCFFCTDYDNDFKVVCITFCKLYPSFREPTEFLLVWSFLYMRFVIRWICMWLSSVLCMSCLCI
jgi:hypothetical protein